jgi:acyl-CoA synthetase (NDP forming)
VLLVIPSHPRQDLHAFTDPTSVAVVGASDNPAKWGYWLATGALEGAGRRAVHLVNRSAGTVLGAACAPDLTSLPETPELVALCVPAAQVPSVVDEGTAMGVRGFLGITAGIPDEPGLATRIRHAGGRLLGANSLGLYDADSHLRLAWGHFSPGPLAIVTQSGQLGSELVIRCARGGIGISRFVSIGNQSDIGATELLAGLASHRSTRLVALYLESFSDGEALFGALRQLRAAGKPTLLLTIGGSRASARVARSHTRSLTSATDVVEAACRAAGVLHVRTPSELVSVARGFLAVGTPSGRRVAIVGDSGGQCGIAADVANAGGLAVPDLGAHTATRLESTLPAGAARENPVDLAGSGEADLTTYATVLADVLADPGVDTALLTGYFGRYGTDNPALTSHELEVVDRIAATARSHDKTVVVHTMAPDGAVADALWRQGVPATGRIEDAVRMVSGLAALSAELPSATRPPLPTADPPIRPGYWAARDLLASAGVAMPPARLARTPDDVRDAASALTAPWVLKAGWIEHKSDADAVALGLADEDALLAAFAAMRARLGEGDYVVEEQDTRVSCIEMLVGARRDPALGPIVVVGLGGTETEVWHDVAVECAPVSDDTATAMIARLRCAPVLAGWRGRPPVDRAGLARLVAALSQLVAARLDLAEIELNPVRVGPRGALAVDVLVIPTSDQQCGDDSHDSEDVTA